MFLNNVRSYTRMLMLLLNPILTFTLFPEHNHTCYTLITIFTSMEATRKIREAWLSWNKFWDHNLLAMGTCFAESAEQNLILRFTTAMAIFIPMMARNLIKSRYAWKDILTCAVYSVEFPAYTSFHPLVSRWSVNDGHLLPPLPQLGCQVAFFMIMDYACRRLLTRFYWQILNADSPSAARIAIEFTVPRTTLIVAVGAIQSLPSLKYFIGDLHFAAIVAWLLIR